MTEPTHAGGPDAAAIPAADENQIFAERRAKLARLREADRKSVV